MGDELTGFGRTHFGEAELGDSRRTDRLVRVADKLAVLPSRSLPNATQSPADLVALYRLMNRQEATHLRRTKEAIGAHQGVVLIAHDSTELDFTSKRSLRGQLGPLGGKNQFGYLCHNSVAVSAAGEPLGLANHRLPARLADPLEGLVRTPHHC